MCHAVPTEHPQDSARVAAGLHRLPAAGVFVQDVDPRAPILVTFEHRHQDPHLTPRVCSVVNADPDLPLETGDGAIGGDQAILEGGKGAAFHRPNPFAQQPLGTIHWEIPSCDILDLLLGEHGAASLRGHIRHGQRGGGV